MKQLALQKTSTLILPPNTLTSSEQGDLRQCESIIERGLATFVDVGNALAKIRDGRLYRGEYQTFEGYCQERWGLTRRHVNYQIAAARAVRNLGTTVPILPTTERHARPLTHLEPEQQREAWIKAVKTAPNSKVTAAHVQKTVEAITRPAMAVHYSSETPEWNTPPEIIDCTLKVLGEIDLDPCSNSRENPNIPAKEHFVKSDDGLARQWYGRVYMNPPYGREIAKWVNYLCGQFEINNVSEAIALLPARTDTEWFRRLRAYPRCFIWGRLRFSGNEVGAPFPSMVVYLGEHTDRFVEVFGEIGDIYSWTPNGRNGL